MYAIDFTQQVLALTRDKVGQEAMAYVNLLEHDMNAGPIPDVDIAIAIGVLPYIDDVGRFLGYVLPHTKHILMNFLDGDNKLNKLRKQFSLLDVRGYSYQTPEQIRGLLAQYGFKVISMQPLATGYMLEASR